MGEVDSDGCRRHYGAFAVVGEIGPKLSVVESSGGDYASIVLRCTVLGVANNRSYRRPSLSHGHA